MNNTQYYVDSLQAEYKTGHAKEHAYRPALKNYLEKLLSGVQAINEPKQQAWGSPDYVVSKLRKNEPIDVGYIEAKDIDVGLDKVEKSEQLKRYLKSLDNLILTNYREFRFFRDGVKTATVCIAEIDDFFKHGSSIKACPDKFAQLETLLLDFVGWNGQTIKSPKMLAEKMANKAQLMRDVFKNALDDEQNPSKSLQEQHAAFKQILIHDMDTAQFADVYAQTIAYGLFTARLHDLSLEDFSRHEARELIPKSNPFLRKLFDYVCGAELEEGVKWIIDALCEVYRAADIKAILAGFGKTTGRNDPIVHFYETFLGEYDAKLRKARGVWYTPEPVVNFIVRAIDEVLQTHFNLPDGLADTSKVKIDVESQTINPKTGKRDIITQEVHRVQLLDVAAGTGTFTAEAIKQIHAKFEGQMGIWSQYVEQDLLPRLHGFEILMASYAMCHLKIDLLLTELGYKPSNPKNPPRLGVYLTNALEEYHPDANTLFGSWLAAEANEASRIKRDMPIMVAYGNPPYSGHSANKNAHWANKLIEAYKQEPGGGKLQEKNPKWLNDDYVKFIRMGEHYVEKNGTGILAYITNNGYLDNPTFRGMRWHLLKTFDDIYIIDLHGNSKKQETAPDGSKDQNVFDIMQGVAIIIAVKHGNRKEELAQVHHLDMFGDRASKYERLWESENIKNCGIIEAAKPNFLLSSFDNQAIEEFDNYLSITDLFAINSVGIVTSRDSLVIDFDKELLKLKILAFLEPQNHIYNKYVIPVGENANFKIKEIRRVSKFEPSSVEKICYRPFDNRYIYYEDNFIERNRREVMGNFVGLPNIGIMANKKVEVGEFNHAYLINNISESHCVSLKEINYAFPLYLYPDEKSKKSAQQGDLLSEPPSSLRDTSPASGGRDGSLHPSGRRPNLNMEIVAQISEKLGLVFVTDHEIEQAENSFNPLDLLDYIYAVLHSPTYRDKYKEFLKIDFPRIPFPDNAEIFWQLVKLGREIRGFHLLEHPALSKYITTFPEGGDCVVEKPIYENGNVKINANQYFGNVPQIAWDFYIGGYQPAQKWLKDRKGRKLSTDDIKHYQKIIIALVNTDRLMKEIDEIWKP